MTSWDASHPRQQQHTRVTAALRIYECAMFPEAKGQAQLLFRLLPLLIT